MSAWQAGDVSINGLRLHYTRTGGAKPPLVLAHGFTDDGLCWTPVAQVLEDDYDVIMVDARGHGRSDAPEQGYGLVEYGSDLAGVITALNLPQPAVLGHSMGAGSALVLAGLYPDIPGAILLEDPPGWWVPSALSPEDIQHREAWRAQIAEQKKKPRAELIGEQRVKFPTWSEAELNPWADSKLRYSLNVLKMTNPGATEAIDWQTILTHIKVPVLLMTADPAHDAALTPEGVAALKALVPQVRVENIPGAGHNIRREQFGRYIQIVKGFLQEFYSGGENQARNGR